MPLFNELPPWPGSKNNALAIAIMSTRPTRVSRAHVPMRNLQSAFIYLPICWRKSADVAFGSIPATHAFLYDAALVSGGLLRYLIACHEKRKAFARDRTATQ